MLGKRISLSVFLALLCISSYCCAQYVPYTSQSIINSNGLKPGSFAQITVCAAGASGNPCTPTVSVYANSTGAGGPLTQPFAADQNGNFTFWAPQGTYTISETFGANTFTFQDKNGASSDTGLQVFNVMAFGAKGNGVTDDTTAFKAAAAAACPGTSFGSVLIPINSTVFISTISSYSYPSDCTLIIDGELKFNTSACASNSCTLIFAGSNQTLKGKGIIDNTGGTNTPILIGKGASNFVLTGSLTIQNAPDGAIGSTVLAGSGTTIGPLRIEGLTMQKDNCDPSTPVFALQLGTTVSDASISNIQSYAGCDYQYGVDGSSNVTFNNIFSDQTNSSLTNYGGIQIEGTSAAVSNVVVSNATFIAPSTSCNTCMGVSVGAPNHNVTNVDVKGVTVQGFGYGIKFQQMGTGTLDGVSLVNSNVHDTGLPCILMLPTGSGILVGDQAHNCNTKTTSSEAYSLGVAGATVMAIGNYAFDNQGTPTTGAGFAYGSGTIYCANVDGPGVTADTGTCTAK